MFAQHVLKVGITRKCINKYKRNTSYVIIVIIVDVKSAVIVSVIIITIVV